MTVNFYKTFSKRKNSTKQPAVADAYDPIDCKLKEDCSIENPSFIISQRTASASGNPVTVNAYGGDMINPVVTLNVIQGGSGTPSLINPRPIGAYGDARIHVNSDTTIIDFGNTVYGGTLDVTTGILTVEYIGTTFKLSEASQGASGVNCTRYNYRFYTDGQVVYGNDGATTSLCSVIDSYVYGTADNVHFYLGVAAVVFYLPNGTDPNTQISFSAKLTTPQTVQLTPAQIALAQGTNVVSTNGNSSIAFSYKKDKIDLTYTYVQVPDFNRYYFVSNVIVLSNNRVEYVLECDPLASFKSNIGSTVARIAFSTTGWDKDITDPRCLAKTTKIKYEARQATELTSQGCYVMTVFNKASGASNGLGSTYVMDAGNMQKVKEWMGDDTVYQALVNYFGGSPMESIFSCTWVPFSYAANPGAGVSVINIGNQDSSLYGITAYVLSGTGILSGTEIQILIPYRYNDFRDASPFTDAQLYLPGIGNVDININDFLDSAKIHILYTMEYGTGDLTYYILDDGGHLIQTASCNVASQCPLGQLNINGGGMVSSIGGVVGGAAALAVGGLAGNAGMAIGGAGALLASATNTVLSYNKRSTSLKGNLGGRTSTEIQDIIFTGYYMDTEDVDNTSYKAVKGRPVGVSHAISNHSGYVQCDDASVNIGGTALERQRINDYLNAGFFYE